MFLVLDSGSCLRTPATMAWADQSKCFITVCAVLSQGTQIQLTPWTPPALNRVYLLPQGACNFVGLGYVGCDGSYDCRSWVVGAAALAPQATGEHTAQAAWAGTTSLNVVQRRKLLAGSTAESAAFSEYGFVKHGPRVSNPAVHELGHNLYLGHSGSSTDE
jgi:hypothetical protein